jgi:predicted MFS family arabinose efflux permease
MNTTEENNGLLLPLPKWKIWYIMIILYGLWFLDYATRMVISPMFPALQKDLGLSDSQLGMLTSVVLGVITLLALPLSYVIDRWRRGKLMSIMGLVWSCGSFFSGFSVNFGQLFASRATLGVGEAAYSSGAVAMITATIKKERRATVISLWNTAIPLGIAFGMMLGGWAAVHVGWRTAFHAVAIPGIILGVLAWFMPDYKSIAIRQDQKDQTGFLSTVKQLLKNKTLFWLYIGFGLFTLQVQACMYWGPTFFNRYFGMNMSKAGLMALSALIAGPLGGILADRVARKNPRNKLILCFISVLLSLGFSIAGYVLRIIPLVFMGTFFMVFFVAAQATVTQEVVPSFQRSSSYGLYVLTQYLLGGLWGPWLCGVISDSSNLINAFYIVTLIGLVGCGGYLLAARHYDSDVNAAKEKDLQMGGNFGS